MNGSNLRFINVLILILFCALALTGLYSLVSPFPSSLFQIHRIAGWALIVLIPWKTAISLRSLSRGMNYRFDRSIMIIVSLLLTVATLTVLALVILWKWQIGSYYIWIGPFAYSAIGWHWGIALGLAPLFILHVWRRWPRPKPTDFAGRRQVLKTLGLGAAAILTWGVSEVLAKSAESTGATTSECTGGWYSTQIWRGVPLADLLAQVNILQEKHRILLKDVSGYTSLFTPDEVSEILLATYVGDQVLNHWHGFPVRVVVPSRRGGYWVKWLTEIEITNV